MKFPFYRQLDGMDCGPTCLRMIARYYGKKFSVQQLRENSYIQRTGVNLLGISEAAESIGLRTTGIRTTIDFIISRKFIDELTGEDSYEMIWSKL